jgi:MFS family permease
MSIKEEGYLHDYIAAGLLGFAVGIGIASSLISTIIGFAAASAWGQVVALSFVSGIFGYLPGGFIAGYVNYRIHKTEGKPMEGVAAGIMALIVHFFITLFVFVTLAAAYGPAAGVVMTGWALSFVFGIIFYPIGGYISGMLESKAIPMPAVLKFERVFAPAPPPPPPPGAEVCPTCGGPLTYIQQYQRWYCYKCKKYA